MTLAPWSTEKVWDLIKHLPLPAIILALGGTAQLIRIMRANLLDELRLFKSAGEIALMRRSADIAVQAQIAALTE